MKSNPLRDKAFRFAVNIVKVSRAFANRPADWILMKQLMRSGTSVGANVEEAIGSHSDKEFIMKITIAYKEARESLYWIKLMESTEILATQTSEILYGQAEELCRMISAIQISMKNKLSSNKQHQAPVPHNS